MISVLNTEHNRYYKIRIKFSHCNNNINKYPFNVIGIRDKKYDETMNHVVFMLTDNMRLWVHRWNVCEQVKRPYLNELKSKHKPLSLQSIAFSNLHTIETEYYVNLKK